MKFKIVDEKGPMKKDDKKDKKKDAKKDSKKKDGKKDKKKSVKVSLSPFLILTLSLRGAIILYFYRKTRPRRKRLKNRRRRTLR